MDEKCFICGDPAETECFKDESGYTLYVCEPCETPADRVTETCEHCQTEGHEVGECRRTVKGWFVCDECSQEHGWIRDGDNVVIGSIHATVYDMDEYNERILVGPFPTGTKLRWFPLTAARKDTT